MEVSGRPGDDCADENQRPGPATQPNSGSRPSGSKWADVQQKLLVPLRATLNFRTLRDMHGEAMLDPEKLVFVCELGEGNYCTVSKYEYVDEEGNKSFLALKKLKPGMVSAQDMLDFMREVKLLKKLRHSRIANFRGTGYLPGGDDESEEVAFLAQDLVEGGSLRALLERQMRSKKEKLYTLTEALTWLLDVSLGLTYLHQAKPQVIHRDLKPENILLTLEKEARVVDFGLHKVIDKWEKEGAGEGEQMFEMTGGTGALMYMPPEAMLGTKYNHKVDVYSFAIIAWELVHYEMLIARVCSSSGNQEDLKSYAKFVALEDYRPPIASYVPRAVADMICDCWSRDPAVRPDFEELVPRLKEIIDELSSQNSLDGNVPKEPQRNWLRTFTDILKHGDEGLEADTKAKRLSCWSCFLKPR